MTKRDRLAWRESISDTAIGFVINVPLNMIMLYIASTMSMSVAATSCMLSIIFTVVAVVRKYLTRIYFSKNKSRFQ